MTTIPMTDLRVVEAHRWWCKRREHVWVFDGAGYGWDDFRCAVCGKRRTKWGL